MGSADVLQHRHRQAVEIFLSHKSDLGLEEFRLIHRNLIPISPGDHEFFFRLFLSKWTDDVDDLIALAWEEAMRKYVELQPDYSELRDCNDITCVSPEWLGLFKTLIQNGADVHQKLHNFRKGSAYEQILQQQSCPFRIVQDIQR